MYKNIQTHRSEFIDLRGLRTHLHCWGPADAPLLVMVHGWMDVGASYQFVVDCFSQSYRVVAPDWRGFGRSDWPVKAGSPGVRSYWFPDYLADLDALLDALSPHEPVDLVGHSMGGNVAMLYAGVRPSRIRSVVNLEGFGMLDSSAEKSPNRYAKWLDELKEPQGFRPYDSIAQVAQRLQRTNHRLTDDKALYLAQHWCEPEGDGYRLLGDAAHKIMNPVGYRLAEAQACWARIEAPVLHVEARQTEAGLWMSRSGEPADFDQIRTRFDVVKNWAFEIVEDAGHMLHHDQPMVVAQLIEQHIKKSRLPGKPA